MKEINIGRRFPFLLSNNTSLSTNKVQIDYKCNVNGHKIEKGRQRVKEEKRADLPFIFLYRHLLWREKKRPLRERYQ